MAEQPTFDTQFYRTQLERELLRMDAADGRIDNTIHPKAVVGEGSRESRLYADLLKAAPDIVPLPTWQDLDKQVRDTLGTSEKKSPQEVNTAVMRKILQPGGRQ